MAGGSISPEGTAVTAPDGRQVRQFTAEQIGQIALIRAAPIGNRYLIDFKDTDSVKDHLAAWAEKFASDPSLANPADKARANEFIARLHDPAVKGDALVNATTDFLKGIEANHGGEPPLGMLLNDRLGRPADNISLATQAYGAANGLKSGDIMLYHDFQIYSDRIPRIQLPGGASLMETAASAPAPAALKP